MKIKVLGKKVRTHKELFREAESLDDAYEKGLFGSGMPRDEFLRRILKKNPFFRVHSNGSYTGLFDTENDRFVCGISKTSRIPRFTILKLDESKNRKVNYTDEHGNFTSQQVINQDEEKGKVLARSWISVFNLLRGQGYEVDDEDIDY